MTSEYRHVVPSTAGAERRDLVTVQCRGPWWSALALQRSAGNRAVTQLVQPGPATPPNVPVLQRGIVDDIADVLDLRYNEKERDEYEDALSDLKDFRRRKALSKERHEPSTGAGLFDVSYSPGDERLTVTVRCYFDFHDSVIENVVDPASDPRAPTMKPIISKWQPSEVAEWKARFFAQANSVWKDTHTFWCQRDWWEDLKVVTRAQFVDEADPNPFKSHFRVTVYRRGAIDKEKNENTTGIAKKTAEWREEMLDPGGQPTGAHEAGHMLGLGDEYVGPGGGPLLHDTLVKAQLGKTLVQGQTNPESLMAHGAKVLPEHGVTFLEALQALTKPMSLNWAQNRKPPRPAPATRPNTPLLGPFGPF